MVSTISWNGTVDVVDNVLVVGYSIEVCDWLLGATEAAHALDGCTA